MRLVPVAYLTSYFLSLLGASVAAVALPLLVLQTTGSPLGAGVLAVATALPAFLAGLLMGVVIDRINRRTSSVLTDLVSAAAIAALPLVDLVTDLNLGWFVLFGVIGSLGDIPGLTAREALLPAVVRHGGIGAERLMGAREVLGAVALLLGPAAAGGLISWLEGSTVLWVTAGTSLLAALITLLIPHRVGTVGAPSAAPPAAGETETEGKDQIAGKEQTAGTTATRPRSGPRGGWAELREGWGVLLGSRLLLSITMVSVIGVVVLTAMQGLVLPVFFTEQGRPALLGLVLTALAAGLLLGGGTYAALGHRGTRRRWFLIGLLGTTVGFALIAPLLSTWWVLAGAFVVGLCQGMSAATIGVLMIERIPDQVRGRVMGTQNAVITVLPPLGLMVAASLTELAGVGVAAVVVVGIWVVALLLGLLARSLRDLEPLPVSQEFQPRSQPERQRSGGGAEREGEVGAEQ